MNFKVAKISTPQKGIFLTLARELPLFRPPQGPVKVTAGGGLISGVTLYQLAMKHTLWGFPEWPGYEGDHISGALEFWWVGSIQWGRRASTPNIPASTQTFQLLPQKTVACYTALVNRLGGGEGIFERGLSLPPPPPPPLYESLHVVIQCTSPTKLSAVY